MESSVSPVISPITLPSGDPYAFVSASVNINCSSALFGSLTQRGGDVSPLLLLKLKSLYRERKSGH